MIKAIITDVDGVLTDGGMYWNEQGLAMKRFHTRDVSAISRLQKKGYKVFAITSACDELTKKRLLYCKFDWKIMAENSWEDFNKVEKAEMLADEFGFTLSEAIYIGDDIMDIALMNRCGLALCPEDSAVEVKDTADFVIPVKGGCGVISYVCSMIESLEDLLDGKSRK